MVIIEYVPYGDLLGYLRKSRGLNDTYYKDPDIKPQTSLTSQQLIKFAWEIADGMSYLSSKSVSKTFSQSFNTTFPTLVYNSVYNLTGLIMKFKKRRLLSGKLKIEFSLQYLFLIPHHSDTRMFRIHFKVLFIIFLLIPHNYQ